MTDDRVVTVGLFLKMLEQHDRQLIFDLVEALRGGGLSVGSRTNRDDGVDEQFAAARKVVLSRPMVSLGDPGHRINDGVHAIPLNKVNEPDEQSDDSSLGPAQRAIRRRRQRRARGDI